KTAEPQEMVSHFGVDQDVFGLYREGGFIEIQVLTIRRGKLSGSLAYGLDDREFPDEEVMAEVLGQYYSGGRFIPDEVLVPVDREGGGGRGVSLADWKQKGGRVFRPRGGDRAGLCERAGETARQSFAARRNSEDKRLRMVAELQKSLDLRSAPKRIECFD